MLNIGIIGYGYWGPNLVRNFLKVNNCDVTAIADGNSIRRDNIKKTYPNIKLFEDGNKLIDDITINAVVIATPVFTHYSLAKKALQSGKHVLLEKPMTSSVSEAEELISLANKLGLTLMVDHTFLYTSAVQKIKEIVDNNNIGLLKYFDSTRINLGLFQPDINVLWDLAPHDISILSFIFPELPYSVNATGISHTSNNIENIAYLTMNYNSNFIAHINCSWTSPVKVRQTLIGGDSKMIVYNDLEPSEKIKIYDTGYTHKNNIDNNSILVDYRIGDIYLPKLNNQEALYGVAVDFCNAIINNTEPLSSSKLGLDVVKILEAANASIKNNGKEIKL